MQLSINKEQIKESTGVYRLIVNKLIETKGLNLSQLEDLFFNKVEEASKYKWLSLSKGLTGKESVRDMHFGTFKTWMQMFDIDLHIQVSAFGEENFTSMEGLFTSEKSLVGTGHSFYEEAPVDTSEGVESGSEDTSSPIKEVAAEDLDRIQKFLEYSLDLFAFGIHAPIKDVATYLRSKIAIGLELMNITQTFEIATVEGNIDRGVKFFIVNLLVDGELVTASIADKY